MTNTMMLTIAAGGMSGSIDRTIPFGTRMLNGVETLVLGLGTVFAVLIIIWIILEISSRIFNAAEKPKKKDKPVVKPEQNAAPADTSSADEEKSDDGALIAAVTAAVYAYLDSEKAGGEDADENVSFKVVSFRRLR